MKRNALTAILLTLTVAAGGCATTPREARSRSVAPALYVPSTSVVQDQHSQGLATLNAYAVLPSSDAETLFVGRPDKFVYGPTVFTEATEYSIQTYDQQLISNIWGPSYRYRYITQSGITSP